jgi:hypothetical protein
MRVRKTLARVPLHLLIGAILFALFHAPLLGTPIAPSQLLIRMFAVWAVAIVALVVFARSDDEQES